MNNIELINENGIISECYSIKEILKFWDILCSENNNLIFKIQNINKILIDMQTNFGILNGLYIIIKEI